MGFPVASSIYTCRGCTFWKYHEVSISEEVTRHTYTIQKLMCSQDGLILPSGKLLRNYGKSPCLMGKSTISMAIFNSKLFYFLLLDMKFRLDGGWGSCQDQRRVPHWWWFSGWFMIGVAMCCHIMLYFPSFPGLLLWVILGLSLDLTDCKLPSILFGFQHCFEIDVVSSHPEKMNLSKKDSQILPAGFIAT
jgi:hypothetical protein